jgi:hypothetical protein
MRRFFLFAFAIVVSAVALVGCRASGEIDPHDTTSIQMPR